MKRIVWTLSIVWLAVASSACAHGPVKPHLSKAIVVPAQSFNRIARWIGLGWSDGYHARNGYAAPMYYPQSAQHFQTPQYQPAQQLQYQPKVNNTPAPARKAAEEIPAPKKTDAAYRTMRRPTPHPRQGQRPSQKFHPHPAPQPQTMQLRPATGSTPSPVYHR